MELCLTGNTWTAAQAESANLISRVVAPDQLMPECLKLANQISSLSLPAVKMAKAAVGAAFETTLAQGVLTERNIFASTFALADKMEGTAAFVQKRKPVWTHQ